MSIRFLRLRIGVMTLDKGPILDERKGSDYLRVCLCLGLPQAQSTQLPQKAAGGGKRILSE